MSRFSIFVYIRLMAMALSIIGGSATFLLAEEPLDFNRDIRPLLSDRCFACHGPDGAERRAGLRLDVEDAAKEYAIVVGDADESLLVERILSTDPDVVMPPPETGKPLTAEEVDRLKCWIDEGAPYAAHWAYVDPTDHTVPQVNNELWSRHPIDAFLYSAAANRGIAMAKTADSITLVRRLAFDLSGLPPSAEDVRSFITDPSEKNYLRLVDRYLNSVTYGQRMAMIWLDLVRYADTVGYHGDQDHSIAPYRDWVIDAFNENLPFDEFTRYQLAGDLIPDATIDHQIASGYNRLLQTSHEGGVQSKEYLAIYAADRVRNVSAVWMGATLGCAQCHDHKYDPYTAVDFYAMSAFFADLDEEQHFKVGTNTLPTKRPPEIRVLRPDERIRLEEIAGQLEQTGDDTQQQSRIEALQAEREQLEAGGRWTMISVAKTPRVVRVLPRGNWLDESGPIVEPAVPHFFGRAISTSGRASRLDLADWLTDVQRGTGGMTARVMANRVWAMLFGAGLSESLEDFGGQGQPPRNPELLDHLAVQLYGNGWNLKHLIRYIVSSRAYRQSSVATPVNRGADPGNQYFARQNRYRLPAEMIRDQALQLGGLLVTGVGGSAKPYQPAGYYRHLNFPPREYVADGDLNQYRRGVYVHWQRQFLHPMLKAFDAPTREECTAQRYRSNTPLAALALMNDPTFVEASRAFANRILEQNSAADDDRRIRYAFKMATSRPVDESELEILKSTLADTRQYFADHPDSADQYLKIGLFMNNDSEDDSEDASRDRVELATWAELCRTMLNLSETITRP